MPTPTPLQPRTSIEYISPEQARRILTESKATGFIQRESSPGRVTEYAGLMTQGRWKLTPTHAIGISNAGAIVDGAHRLKALAKQGDSFVLPVWVCRGVDESTFGVIDRGIIRTDFQIARIAGSSLGQPEWSAIRMACVPPSRFRKGSIPKLGADDSLALERFFANAVSEAFPRDFEGYSGLSVQGFRAALTRAFKHFEGNPEKLSALRDFTRAAITNSELKGEGSSKIPKALHIKIQALRCAKCRPIELYPSSIKAIYAFMDGSKASTMEAVENLKRYPEDLFPLSIDNRFTLNGSRASYNDILRG